MTIGLVVTSPEKLIPYRIKVGKAIEKKAAPTKVLHPTIENDTDEEGFILTVVYDPDAATYEWMKGFGTDASKPNLVSVLKLFNVTTQIFF